MYGPLKALIAAKGFLVSEDDELLASDHQGMRDYLAHFGMPKGVSEEITHALHNILGGATFVVDELTELAGGEEAAAAAQAAKDAAASACAAAQAAEAAAVAQAQADAKAAEEAAAAQAVLDAQAASDAAALAASGQAPEGEQAPGEDAGE